MMSNRSHYITPEMHSPDCRPGDPLCAWLEARGIDPDTVRLVFAARRDKTVVEQADCDINPDTGDHDTRYEIVSGAPPDEAFPPESEAKLVCQHPGCNTPVADTRGHKLYLVARHHGERHVTTLELSTRRQTLTL